MSAKIRNRRPPTLIMKVLASFFYIVPWLDIMSLAGEYNRRFPTSVIFFTIPDPFEGIYYSSQFAPLIIFFLLFLSVVKNFKLHHFTRFHCMQAIVLDIVTMLFTLVRQYFPAEIRWSPLMNWYDMFAFNACMCTIVYCIVCALMGRYANVTFVSESTYMQVEEGDK